MKKADKIKIENTKLDYNKSGMFMHCKHCLEPFLKSVDYKAGLLSPHDAMSYEMSTYPFEYPDGKIANIAVVWCKKCEKVVWDSRHLTHLY